LETTAIQRGTTPFAKRKGERIAHEAVTAVDEGVSSEEFGSVAMDDEGMPAQHTVLIENGILRNFLSDRRGESNTGHPRTGSGRRQDFSFAAASRMRNTYIAPGPHRVEDLFAAIGDGLYCARMGGGSVGPGGEFNFAVNEAWEIRGGKLKRPLKGAILVGNAPEILQRISMCADDVALAAGFCGSVSGSIYTTVGQPHILIDKISIGGR
jgi:TldD protein